MKIENGRLRGERIEHFFSPNIYGTTMQPAYAIIHLTAGPINEVHDWWMAAASMVAAHVCILRDGSIRQYAGFHEKVGHAGVSWTESHGWWANNYSVGVEFENPCNLTATNDLPPLNWRTWRGAIYDEPDIFTAQHAISGGVWGWQRISWQQWETGVNLCRLLGLPLLGHDEISSGEIRQRAVDLGIWKELTPAKLDPGPAIDMESFRDEASG